MKKTECFNSKSLLEWSEACLRKMGMTDKDALLVASSLVQTSLWGIDSHGIARLPHYLNRIEAGSLNVNPQLEIENTGPCTSNMNGDNGLGIVVVNAATQESISLAQKNGVGILGIRESSHCGAIGLYGRMIAKAGLIGIVFTHSDAFVAPHRGFQKFIGTNPICISMPNMDGQPLCLDMATSDVAWNKVMNARKENSKIADDLAYDINGDPTDEPDLVACLKPMAGHKGYGLAVMIDLLCGPLNGAPWGINIPAMYGDLTQKRNLGSLVIAINPSCFFGGSDFSGTVAAMAESARNQPVKDDNKPVLVPGDDHYENEKERSKYGIPVGSGFYREIEIWSEKLKVALPKSL